jgi:octaprenyl-diphosphate synthase
VTAVELAHVGSLLHDDIIDSAQLRRGRPTAHVLFDVPTAILAGDVLLTVAFERVVDAPADLRRSFTVAVRDVCRGESLERERLFDPTVDVAHALLVNRLKTAALFRYAAEAGAILSGATTDVVAAARDYGSALGEAFQLADDLLDFCGDPAAIGKPVGLDLSSGCITVPMAIACERDPTLRERVLELWESENGDGERALAGLHLPLARTDAFAVTREMAQRYAGTAEEAAHRLTAGQWRDQLTAFAREVARYADPPRHAAS